MAQQDEDRAVTSEAVAVEANEQLIRFLNKSLLSGRQSIADLRTKLSRTYLVVISLSVVMFFVGVALLYVPFYTAIWGNRDTTSTLQSIAAGGFGLANIAALFLFRPLQRIHGLMGDMSQIIVALNSFQTQVGLRLLAMDTKQASTISEAAEEVNDAAKESIVLIQKYFESRNSQSDEI